MLGTMRDSRKAIHLGAMAILVLFGGCFVALVAPRFRVAIVMASFAGYVACSQRALALRHADDLVFEGRDAETRERAARDALRDGLRAGSAGALSFASRVHASSRPNSFGSARGEQPVYPRRVERTH